MQDTISAKGQRWDVGVKYPNGRTTNTGVERKGTIISYLIAFERLFRTKQTKKEPACSVAEQAGVPIDRVFVGIDRAKEVILPLDLEAYRFCLHGECRFDRSP